MLREGYAMLLLRACGVSPPMLVQIHPYAGRFPKTEEEFTAMEVTLRRMGHILENAHMNIGSRLFEVRACMHTLTFSLCCGVQCVAISPPSRTQG